MKKTLTLLTVMSSIAATPALAVEAGVPFNGEVRATCTIDVTDSGSMASINNATVLSSKSGSAGLATITTTGHNFEASVANPPDANFVQTIGTGYNAGDATLVADMTVLDGASSGNYAATSTATLGAGDTNVAVDLVATMSSGSFPNGDYVGTVVLTCE